MERFRWHPKKSRRQVVIDWLIFLSIILFLAAIAIPDFLKFRAKARSSEVRTYLGEIYTLQKKYHDQHGGYAGGPDAFLLLDWKPTDDTNYAYFCAGDYIPNAFGKGRPRIGKESRPANIASSATGFTCAAVGNVDDDPALDYWSVNDQKVFKNEPSDLFP